MACVSVRVCVDAFRPTASMRRSLKRNRDLIGRFRPPQATSEQYSLFRRYLDSRHAEGGMAHMSVLDYALMVEDSHVEQRRRRIPPPRPRQRHHRPRRGPDRSPQRSPTSSPTACRWSTRSSSPIWMPTLARHLHDPRPHRAGPEARQALRLSRLLGRWLAEDGLQGPLPAAGAADAEGWVRVE